MLPAKFGSIWPSSFRGEDFFNISQSPLLLKIEHRVKLHVFGNNSKTINNIRNLTWIKMISTGRSNYPEILKKILLPILQLLPFFRQIFKILILFVFYFKNYKNCRACRSWQAEHVFSLHSTSISYSFWNKAWKVLTFFKFDEKRAITSRWVIRFTLTILELLPFFHQIFKILILFVFYFKNYKR
jgi:hypothetical protein